MLASLIIEDVRRELLETNAGFWSDVELLRLLNRGEADFVNKTRILEDTAFLTTLPGQAEYILPGNWLSSKLVLFNSKQDPTEVDSWVRLRPTSLEKVGQETPNFLNTTEDRRGTPEKYFIWGNTLFIFRSPKISNSSDLFLFYKAKPIALTAVEQSINIDDSLAEGLNAYILWKAWAKAKEITLAANQEVRYERYIGQGRRWAKRRLGDGRHRIDIESNIPINLGSTIFSGFFDT